jgi:hypothetical protein
MPIARLLRSAAVVALALLCAGNASAVNPPCVEIGPGRCDKIAEACPAFTAICVPLARRNPAKALMGRKHDWRMRA